MPPSFRDIVDQFISVRSVMEFETADFRGMRHDRDLVPGIRSRLARVAQAYGYFTALTHETQGINDNGSDVSVVYRLMDADGEAPRRVLGFQVKSDSELSNDDVMGKLKAQRDDALRKIPNLEHYYILLCGDESRLKKRLSAIRSEFLNAERTVVLSPMHVMRFLRLEEYQIDAQVKRSMDEQDVVLRAMRDSLESLEDTGKVLVIALAARLVSTGDASMRIPELQYGATGRMYDRIIAAAEARASATDAAHRDHLERLYDLGEEVDCFEDPGSHTLRITSLNRDDLFASDINDIVGDLVEQTNDGDLLTLQVDSAAPVVAVAADALVRYSYSEDELLPYLLDLAGVDV
jgi:hypothetical protein